MLVCTVVLSLQLIRGPRRRLRGLLGSLQLRCLFLEPLLVCTVVLSLQLIRGPGRRLLRRGREEGVILRLRHRARHRTIPVGSVVGLFLLLLLLLLRHVRRVVAVLVLVLVRVGVVAIVAQLRPSAVEPAALEAHQSLRSALEQCDQLVGACMHGRHKPVRCTHVAQLRAREGVQIGRSALVSQHRVAAAAAVFTELSSEGRQLCLTHHDALRLHDDAELLALLLHICVREQPCRLRCPSEPRPCCGVHHLVIRSRLGHPVELGLLATQPLLIVARVRAAIGALAKVLAARAAHRLLRRRTAPPAALRLLLRLLILFLCRAVVVDHDARAAALAQRAALAPLGRRRARARGNALGVMHASTTRALVNQPETEQVLLPCGLLRLAQRGALRRSHRRLGLACGVLRALLRTLLLALEHLCAQSGLDLRPGRVELEAEDAVAVVAQLL